MLYMQSYAILLQSQVKQNFCQVTTARKLVDGLVLRARDDEKAAGNFNQSFAIERLQKT